MAVSLNSILSTFDELQHEARCFVLFAAVQSVPTEKKQPSVALKYEAPFGVSPEMGRTLSSPLAKFINMYETGAWDLLNNTSILLHI